MKEHLTLSFKTIRFLSVITFTLTLFVSCKDISDTNIQDRCLCPLEEVSIKDKTDSLRKEESNQNSRGINGGGLLDKKVLKFFSAELNASYNNTEERFSVQTIIQKTSNEFPQISNFQVFKSDMYCALISVYCRDSSITNEELNRLKIEELLKVEQQIEALLLAKIQGHTQHEVPSGENLVQVDQPQYENKVPKAQKIIVIDSEVLEAQLSKKIEEHINSNKRTSPNNDNIVIKVIYDGDYEKVPLSQSNFTVGPGNIKVYANNVLCNTIVADWLQVNMSDFSGPKSLLKSKIKEVISNLVNSNFQHFTHEIKTCL